MNPEINRHAYLSAYVPAILAFFIYFIFSFWILSTGHLHEDAYILFSYADHLANGDGIVYFKGGGHAEGATDFLWMVLLSFLSYIGIDIGLAATILNGFGIGLITYILIMNLKWEEQPASQLIVGGLLAVTVLLSQIPIASINGFSTAFYASISLLLMHLYLNASTSRFFYLPIISLLLGLIRPDGVIIGLFASLIGLEKVWNSADRKTYIYSLLISASLGCIYFVWRYNYFGHLLPLPLYVKSYSEDMFPGYWKNIDYFKGQILLLGIALFLIIKVRDKKRYILSFVPVLVLIMALFFAHQTQNVAYRFQAPFTAALLLCFSIFAGKYLANVIPWRKYLVVSLMVPVLAISSGEFDAYSTRGKNDYINYFPFLARDILNKNVKLALTEAGRMAYWNDSMTFDLVGLNTPQIAINMLDVEYLEKLDPDVIFIHTAHSLKPDIGPSEKNTIYTDIDFIEQHLKKRQWQNVKNPVHRAPYVVYEFLKTRPQKYNLVFAKVKGEFNHLYAVKVDGEVSWNDFKEKLEDSFKDESRMSYFEIEKQVNGN